MVTLEKLLDGVEVVRGNAAGVSVEDVSFFVGDIKPHWVYVACELPGLPGYGALKEAVELGATVVVADREVRIAGGSECRVVLVRDSKKAYSTMCANLFGNAHRHLSLYAVTGTTGKTSTCYLLESIFRNAGLKTGKISTIARQFGEHEISSSCTTPEPHELHWLLREMYNQGVSHVILEVSSIGIAEERIWGLEFDGVVFTNIGHEHLTYHGGMQSYQQAKCRLFTEYTSAGDRHPVCAINVDGPFGKYLATVAKGDVITYGVNGELNGDALVLDESGIEGTVCGVAVRSSLIGTHNAYNILAAIALCHRLGLPAESIAAGISSLRSIPGRLEQVKHEGGASVFVDYAHTPESVWNVMKTLRTILPDRRLVVVIGCGGNSDAQKRPIMGRIATENSDACIFTSDNPRHENPLDIVGDMLGEIDAEKLMEQNRLEIMLDRRAAIYRGVELAAGENILLILGKGHEGVQIIGERSHPFDDREVACEALRHYSESITVT